MLCIFYQCFFKKSRITILHVYFRAIGGTETFLNMKEAENRIKEKTGGEQGHLSSPVISETGDKRSGSPISLGKPHLKKGPQKTSRQAAPV